jgi:hypothetical protein
MLICNDCRVTYDTLMFCCPSCGAPLISVRADIDTVVFSGGSWEEIRAIAVRGRIQNRIASVSPLNAGGFEVVSGDGIHAQAPLQRLYEMLTQPGEVIEL